MVVREFEPFLPAIVDIGEADQVASYLASRVIAMVFPERPDSRQTQLQSPGGMVGTHMTPQVDEFAVEIARDPPGEPVGVELQYLGQLVQPLEGGLKFLRSGPDAVDRCTDRQRLAVAIRDRPAVGRNLHGPDVAVVALRSEKILLQYLQIEDAPLQDRAGHDEDDEQRGASPTLPDDWLGLAIAAQGAGSVTTRTCCGEG